MSPHWRHGRTVNHIDIDILGKAAGDARVAGPLGDADTTREWKVDPRSKA
jgi:hypothetical protein